MYRSGFMYLKKERRRNLCVIEMMRFQDYFLGKQFGKKKKKKIYIYKKYKKYLMFRKKEKEKKGKE